MKNYVLIFLFILALLLTPGCWSQLSPNNAAVCSGLGVDILDTGKIVFTVQLNRPINFLESSLDSQFDVLTGVGRSITEAARKITLTLPRLPLWQHADIFIIGETLAKDDLAKITDFLARNRNIRESSYLLISHGATPNEVLGSNCPLAICSARGILRILKYQDRELGIYVPVTLNEFIYKLATPGIDAVAPMVSVTKDIKGQKILTVDAMGVFKDRKLVGTLNTHESRGYRWLNSTTKKGGIISVISPSNPQDRINLKINQFRSKMRPRIENNKVIIDISVNVETTVAELTGTINMSDPNSVKRITTSAEKEIKKQIMSCINKSKNLKSDFLGIGQNIHRYKPKEWEKLKNEWDTNIAEVESNINVKVNLQRSNLVKNNFLYK